MATNTNKLGTFYTYNVPSFDYYCSYPAKLITIDEIHKGWRHRRRKHTYRDLGGPFDSKETKIERINSGSVSLVAGPYSYKGEFCDGYFGPNPVLGSHITDTRSLADIGSKGIARFRPGNPVANVGQFIYELRDIPRIPALVTTSGARLLEAVKKVTTARGLGSEYLNIEFGWKPFLKDLADIIVSRENLDKRIKQLRRDNGKVVRRHGRVERTESSSVTDLSGTCRLYPIVSNALYWSTSPSNFKGSLYTKSSTDYWFSGAFRYWIPEFKNPDSPVPTRTILKLLGSNPTPGLVWKVLPWTWLFDWFANVNSILDNMSGNAAENLVIVYGYAMGTKKSVSISSNQARFNNGATLYTTARLVQTHKRRLKAYPFGFSLTLPNFSDRQLAILSALGLSRRR